MLSASFHLLAGSLYSLMVGFIDPKAAAHPRPRRR